MKVRRMLFLTFGVLTVLAAAVAPARRLQAQVVGPLPEVTSDVSTGTAESPASTAMEGEEEATAQPEPASGKAESPKTSPEPLVTNRVTPYLVNGALVVLALMTLVFTGSFLREMWRDRPVKIETSWGGFGGGLGGWWLSPSLVYLIASLVFGSLLCMTVVGLTEKDRPTESSSTTKADKPAESEKAKDGK